MFLLLMILPIVFGTAKLIYYIGKIGTTQAQHLFYIQLTISQLTYFLRNIGATQPLEVAFNGITPMLNG